MKLPRRKSSMCVLLPTISNCFFSVCESTRWRARWRTTRRQFAEIYFRLALHTESVDIWMEIRPIGKSPVFPARAPRSVSIGMRCYKFSINVLYANVYVTERILLRDVGETWFMHLSIFYIRNDLCSKMIRNIYFTSHIRCSKKKSIIFPFNFMQK